MGGATPNYLQASCLNSNPHHLYYNNVPPDDFTLDGNVMHNI